MSEQKLPRDMKLGDGTFKAGIRLETFLKAVERHNRFLWRLYHESPRDLILKISNEQTEADIKTKLTNGLGRDG
jgi:hypothetical protein